MGAIFQGKPLLVGTIGNSWCKGPEDLLASFWNNKDQLGGKWNELGVGWILESELLRYLLGDAEQPAGPRSLELREDMKAGTASLREISFLEAMGQGEITVM